jgi:hypothetical protein
VNEERKEERADTVAFLETIADALAESRERRRPARRHPAVLALREAAHAIKHGNHVGASAPVARMRKFVEAVLGDEAKEDGDG